MRISVIIRSKDEADRLRLTLASLAMQSVPAQVVVVNDGSSDHTQAVVAEAAADGLDLISVCHRVAKGRSAAANAGAEVASGDILVFLDGDTLAEPSFVERHLECHVAAEGLVVRGETYHLRCTRPFLDPEAGTPRPGEEEKVARMSAVERTRSLVTRDQIRCDFESINRRGQPGIYPGFGPRRLFDLEMESLRQHPHCETNWAAASGSNQSVSRADFLSVGGFHSAISINEHRELALRLVRSGLTMSATEARSYHMTHRSGWRDPLTDLDWEDVFYAEHPEPAVALMPLFWLSIAEPSPIPEAARITTLPALAQAARSCRVSSSREAIRAAHLAAVGCDLPARDEAA